MGNRFQQFLLAVLATGVASTQVVVADDSNRSQPVQVITSDVEPVPVQEPDIDTEFFELGLYTGLMTIEDFSTEVITGISGTFHATEDFFLQFNAGITEVDPSPAEEIQGDGVVFFTDRDFQYYNLLVGYNIFPGETFFSSNRTYNSAFYLIGGFGNTSFADEDNFTLVLGSGYRVVLSDAFTWYIDYRDHIFSTELQGEKNRTHNIELTTGLTYFF